MPNLLSVLTPIYFSRYFNNCFQFCWHLQLQIHSVLFIIHNKVIVKAKKEKCRNVDGLQRLLAVS